MLLFEDLCHANVNWRNSDLLTVYDGYIGDEDKYVTMTVLDAREIFGSYEVIWFCDFDVRVCIVGYGFLNS